MNKFTQFLVILITCSITGLSQNKILDKPWIKENYPYRNFSSYVHFHYSNSMFALEQSKEILNLNKIDSILNSKYNTYPTPPLKIKDCVYFNPSKKYINKYIPKENNLLFKENRETFFYLNNFYYTRFKHNEPNLIFPYSARFYVDTSNISIIPKQTEMVLDTNTNIPIDNYLKPFYFRKYEVTNLEYREFVIWVRDSIVREMLLDGGMKEFGYSNIEEETEIINWETPIPWDSPLVKELLEPLYYHYGYLANRKKIDSRKLNYVYYYLSNKGCPDSSSNFICREVINVYPDTLCWVKDFNWSFNEPMTSHYFWHPAYNDYPVVGVNYHQAIAFLNWKTEQHQKELDKKGIKIEVEYDLPTEAEWDVAATAEIKNKQIEIYTKNYYKLSDNSWITDLYLSQENNIIAHTDSVINNNHYISKRNNFLFEELKRNYRYKNEYKIDGALHTHKTNINLINKKKELVEKNEFTEINQDELGICFMGGNVSEWLKESYQENWKPVFELRQKILNAFDEKDAEILSLIEKYYDQNNHQNGKLVRGSNWYDERFSNKLGKNIEGMNAKVFVNPDSTYSTLGFRYVIHVKIKDY